MMLCCYKLWQMPNFCPKYTANKFAVLDRDTCLSKWKNTDQKALKIGYKIIKNQFQ